MGISRSVVIKWIRQGKSEILTFTADGISKKFKYERLTKGIYAAVKRVVIYTRVLKLFRFL